MDATPVVATFLPDQISQAFDIGPGDDPLQHLIVERQDSFQRRVAFGDRHQGATAGAGKLHRVGDQGLQAGGVLHEDQLQLKSFLLSCSRAPGR